MVYILLIFILYRNFREIKSNNQRKKFSILQRKRQEES